ncbi:DHS-like NAD/FAD-binding domain-containing protein, partial [Dioszegia hungarica]
SSPGAGPSRPTRSFGEVEETYHIHDSLVEVVRAIRGAKRIVVVSGAGVSTAARIPDFRSAEALPAAGKKKEPSVRDLFHVKSLSEDDLLPAHHKLLNSLYDLSDEASPTPYHSFLSSLDRSGQLLRCYTQNIDGLEEKAGLEVGLPRPLDRSSYKRKRTPARGVLPRNLSLPSTPQSQSLSSSSTPYPRVIPLHGLLATVKCTFCPYTAPFSQVYPLPSYHLSCPACSHHSNQRSALSQRKRSEGILRPDVVLYGEEHPQGHLIGKVVERDLKGLGGKDEKEGKVDMLIVAGTSLSIPGVKRMVKEMSRVLGERSGLRRVFINDDAPAHPKEWEGMFNVWVKGDIQHFVTDYLANPAFGSEPPTPPKTPRKRSTKVSDTPAPTPSAPSTPPLPSSYHTPRP